MIARKSPKCHLCGEKFKGKYLDQSKRDPMHRFVGDSFKGWDYDGHAKVCKGTVAILTLPEEKKNTMENLPEEYNLLKKLPKSQEAIKLDANARAFYMLLLQGQNPYTVIDEMISHYTKVKNDLYEKLTASSSVATPKEETKKGNGTTIEQQIKAVDGEVRMYASRMTWHPHQMDLDDAVRSLSELASLRQQLKDRIDKEIRGDRMIVDLEHEKTVLKTQLKEREESITELLPIAERFSGWILENIGQRQFNEHQKTISRAKALLDKQ